MDASEDTAEFRLHIHSLLHDYAVTHCTTNFLAFTENAVLQCLQTLPPAPLTDPFSLVVAPDPYDAFSRIHDLPALQPYDEISQTTNDARLYLKKWMGSGSGKPKTETVMFEDDYVEPPWDGPLFPVRTRAARLATPNPGKLQPSIFAPTHNDLLMKNQRTYVQVEAAELDQAFRCSKRPRVGAGSEVSDIEQGGHAGPEAGSPLRLPPGNDGKESLSPLPQCQRSVLQHTQGDSNPWADSDSGRRGRKVGFAENLVDRPTAGEDLDHHSGPPFDIEPEISRHALGIAAFAQLRAKTITEIVVAAPTPILELPIPPDAGPRKTPKELIDANTICLPETIYPPNSIHKYMASLNMIQKRVLVRSLWSQKCSVELAERESLNGVDLILDPFTGVIFIPLFVIPSRCNCYVERISQQSWRFRQLLVVLEAYPESHSKRVRTVRGAVHTLPVPELCAYTVPIIKAIRKLRRDLDIAVGCASRSASTKVQYAFADTVDEAALLTRYYGNFVETIDPTQGAVWGDRFWLDLDFVEDDEANLALAGGMNRFSAAIALCMVSLQDLVEMSPMERTEGLGGYIGVQEIETFNAYLDARVQVVASSTPTFF